MTPIELYLFIPPVILLALAPYTWRHRTTPGARSFFMLILAVAAWGTCYALQLAAVADLAIKSFWSSAKYVGITVTPVVWFAFALEYTGHGEWLTRRRFNSLLIMPLITIVMAFANPSNLMWAPPQLVMTAQFVTVDSAFGPWFWLHATYSYVFILLGIALLTRSLRRFPQMYQQQIGPLILAVALPLIANAIFIFGLSPIPYLDLTPLAFTVSALLFAWALFRFRLLDIAPLARDAVFTTINDVMIVINLENRIVDINPAGQRALGRTENDIIGHPVEHIFSDWSHLVERYRDMREVHEEIALPAATGSGQSYFDLRVTPISDSGGRLTGRLVVLHDITQGRLTEALSDSEQRMRHRVTQLETVAEVSSAVASERDLAQLLNQTARLIGERFGFYHVGIFLMDEYREYAVLRASNSPGGKRMLDRRHRLKIGETGIVGYATGSGEARIALDVGKDAVFFDNPDLPATRSEMALPLKVGGKILGALDIQSTVEAAFTPEDIATLQILADQMAIAIENAELFAANQAALEAARRAYGEVVTQAWRQRLETTEADLGFRSVERGGITQLRKDTWSPESSRAIAEERSVLTEDAKTLCVPILVRGQAIGALRLVKPDNSHWTEIEVQTIQALSDQLSGAVESARLYDDAQRRGEQERIISEITSKISSSINIRNVLQTAVEELGRALPGSEVIVQFQGKNDIGGQGH